MNIESLITIVVENVELLTTIVVALVVANIINQFVINPLVDRVRGYISDRGFAKPKRSQNLADSACHKG